MTKTPTSLQNKRLSNNKDLSAVQNYNQLYNVRQTVYTENSNAK